MSVANFETKASDILNETGAVLDGAAKTVAGAADTVNNLAGSPGVSIVTNLIPHGPEIVAVVRTTAATLSAIANLFEKFLESL